MRIVRHPNIVQLKAFYYSNGERVCDLAHPVTSPNPLIPS
jgi:glycogen synthase kinase 3 beta